MQNTVLPNRAAFFLRVFVGLLFGVFIALLIPDDNVKTGNEHVLPHNWDAILGITIYITAFILWSGAGVMRRLNLGIWFILSFILIGYIAVHAIGFDADANDEFRNPKMLLWLFPLIFIMNELVVAADVAAKPIAPYEVYFDEAWKRGVQLIFALIFTGLMWLILLLGGSLLKVIGFNWLKELIEQQLFIFPISGLAMGIAVHLGDVQPKLLANVRNLALNILSWLLIVITLVGLIFVISLFFSGLKPLWDTKAATFYLLSACVFLVLLINAAYGSGEETDKISIVLRISIRIASVLLLIISAIAVYGLWLRVNQYGLTSERILALVAVIIAVSYGILYTLSNALRGSFMVGIAKTNIYMAIFTSAIFIGLLTPILDPSRLSVNSQIGRLLAGKITPEKFDWKYLKFNSGKYGLKALDKLEANPKYASFAKNAKSMTYRDQYEANKAKTLFKPDSSQFVILDQGKSLPPSFMQQEFNIVDNNFPRCMVQPASEENYEKCYVRFIDLNNDGTEEMIISYYGSINLFYFDGKKWDSKYMDGFQGIDDFKTGNITKKRPEWDDLEINGKRVRVQ